MKSNTIIKVIAINTALIPESDHIPMNMPITVKENIDNTSD
jgi:hypothetical protein